MKELTIHHFAAREDRPARVRVSYCPEMGAQSQGREAEFKFSISDEQHRLIQWYLEEFLIYPWGEFRTRSQQAEDLMTRLGEELFLAVFGTEETRALYWHVADNLDETRVVVHADAPQGIALPWELLRDPTRGEYGDLARVAYTFVRSQPNLIFEPPRAPAGDTFNILLVICRPGGPEGDVPFQSVARPLLELFRPHRDRVRLDVLRPPTFEQLARVLNEKPNFYHVLHFDGHGTFLQGTDPARFYAQSGAQGRLLFEGEDGQPRPVTGEELGGLLAGKGVPLVLLNACQSGMTHPESLYPSVGNQLLQAGARGVVAMAYSVYVQTAVRFMARLYEGLINGEELARATALAREELRAHPGRSSPIGEIELRDWIVPVLFEAAPLRVMEPRPPLHLDRKVLHGEQAAAGAEIDCPEPPVFGFVGRDGVMLELERAFQGETTVLLQGMAGVGKTEMAMGFARWRAETGALGGPIFFFRFEHYLPLAQVCDRVGGVFNAVIRQQLGQDWHVLDAGQRRQVALAILKQVPCLLIWDDFEPVAGFPAGTPSAWKQEEQDELREFLRDLGGGQTRVLLTSRRDEPWLGNIYRRLELGGLKLVEVQELALRVLRRAGLNAGEIRALPEYNELLRYLRGNPLAIQVILPELKRTTPDALLGALQAGATTLSGDDPQQGRERSLTASLTYRLDALDPVLRQRLGILALFQGFVDADVLAAMCQVEEVPELIAGLGRDDWLRMLEAAAEVGLLRRVGEGYYTVHPALPWFFHDLLREAFPGRWEWFEGAFSAVYGAHGRRLFQLFNTNTQLAMTRLRAEENNLMHALRLARRHEGWDDVEGILYGLRTLLTTQGRWVEWERLIAGLEAEASDAQGEPLPGREQLWRALLGHRSELAEYIRDLERAEAIYLRLKEHYERVGDDRNQAVALHQLGMIAQERRQFEEAEHWYRQSLEIKERIGDEHGQAITLHQLGRIAQEWRQFEEAERWYRQSLEIKERIGDEHGQAITLHQLGVIAQERQQFEEAERWYRQSLAIAERIGDEHSQAVTYHQLGMIAQQGQQFDEAERWYRQSLAIGERIDDERGQAQTLHQLGNVAYLLHEFKEAERWYRQSLAIKVRLGDDYGQVQTYHQLGRIAQERRQFEEAERWYRQSLAIAERIGDEHSQAMTYHQLGLISQQRQQFDEAERWYRQSLALKERVVDEYGEAVSLYQLGRIAEERGNLNEAQRFYRAAEEFLTRMQEVIALNIVREGLRRVSEQPSEY
jgi:tetratricopeptide (TPR) repeat protein